MGTSRPSVSAVLRLITSLNLTGACAGRSAGFSPLKMRSNVSRWRGARVVEKEAQHLTRGVGASRIGVGSRGAATRPRVAGSVDVPLLEDCPPARVDVDGAGVGMSSRYPTMMHVCLQARS